MGKWRSRHRNSWLCLKMNLDPLVTFLSFWLSKILAIINYECVEVLSLSAVVVQNFPLSVLHWKTWELKWNMPHSVFSKK